MLFYGQMPGLSYTMHLGPLTAALAWWSNGALSPSCGNKLNTHFTLYTQNMQDFTAHLAFKIETVSSRSTAWHRYLTVRYIKRVWLLSVIFKSSRKALKCPWVHSSCLESGLDDVTEQNAQEDKSEEKQSSHQTPLSGFQDMCVREIRKLLTVHARRECGGD